MCSIVFTATHLTFNHCGGIGVNINNAIPIFTSPNTVKYLTLDKWQHLSYTYDSSFTLFRTYLDGVQIYQQNVTLSQYLNVPTGIIFGYPSGWPLNGELSDLNIFNRALTGSEIIKLSN